MKNSKLTGKDWQRRTPPVKRGYFCVLLFTAIILFCKVNLPAAEWTILVYMAADNGLNDYAIADINEMEAATSNSNVNVIVQIDQSEDSPTPGAKRYKIHHDNTPNQITSSVIQNLGEIDSGDYHSLIDFANWGFNRYPSNHKLLVLWSHGNSWYKGNSTKWICSDNTSDSAIEVWNGDLKEAMSSIPKIDILLFDACSMQSIEVLNEVYRNCDYVIGSEDLVPATGFPYTDILNSLHADTSPFGLTAMIPGLYVNSYQPLGSQNPEQETIPVSCSYAICSKFPLFREQLDTFAHEWKSAPENFITARDAVLNFNDLQSDVDFNEFLVRTMASLLPDITQLGDDAYNLQIAFLDTFPHQYNNEYTDIPAGYATIWFPAKQYIFGGLWQRYGYLDFAETEWSEFLNEFNGPDVIPPLKPTITNVHQELNSLFVNWEEPPDPGLLVYDVWIRDQQGGLALVSNHVSNTTTQLFFEESSTILIRAIDESGNISAADSVFCIFEEPGNQMYFAPTPIHDIRTAKMHIYVHKSFYQFQWNIYDITGKQVFTYQFDGGSKVGDSVTAHTINLGDFRGLEKLSSGIYFAVVTGNDVYLRSKLVIAK